MNKIYLLFFIFILIHASSTSASPKLAIPGIPLDLGIIVYGEQKSLTIQLTNNGDETLRIKSIRTSCGCLSAIVDSKNISPDKKTTLHIMFNSFFKTPGHHYVLKVFIHSNQPDNSLAIIPITVDVTTRLKNIHP